MDGINSEATVPQRLNAIRYLYKLFLLFFWFSTSSIYSRSMENKTREVFDNTASTYDQDRSRLLPGCEAFYGWAVNLIPAHSKRIVELGAGSGILTTLVRMRFAHADLHLMDFSAPMLELAKRRIGTLERPLREDPHITFHQADYLIEPIPSEACAVISSLSIHHLADDEKRRLFARIHAALKPDGTFVNADQVLGPTKQLEERYRALWVQQVKALGATEQQIAASLYRQREDRCAPVDHQLLWMRQAGFADADCWYKEGRFAVMAGTRQQNPDDK